jgi:hypothetical protein
LRWRDHIGGRLINVVIKCEERNVTLGLTRMLHDACNGIEYSSNHFVSCFEARSGVLTLLVLWIACTPFLASAQATAR